MVARLRGQSGNRTAFYVEPPRKVGLRRGAFGKRRKGLLALVTSELGWAAHMDAALLGALAPFAGARE